MLRRVVVTKYLVNRVEIQYFGISAFQGTKESTLERMKRSPRAASRTNRVAKWQMAQPPGTSLSLKKISRVSLRFCQAQVFERDSSVAL